MKTDCLILGAFQTNCYILRKDQTAKDCLIIDTGLEAGPLIDFLKKNNLNPAAIVLTHGHADHINGIAALRENYPDIKVYIHKLDAKLLTEPDANLLAPGAKLPTNKPADFCLQEPDAIEQAGIKLQVLHTPGHTTGGICLYSPDDQIIFTGDTLFAGSVGRVDLGGSMPQLLQSIKEKLAALPDQTVVCPGHGPITNIAQEKANNPYLQ